MEISFNPQPKKSEYECYIESRDRALADAKKILKDIEFTYVVHIYAIRLTTIFRIYFYNKEGKCIDIQTGYINGDFIKELNNLPKERDLSK